MPKPSAVRYVYNEPVSLGAGTPAQSQLTSVVWQDGTVKRYHHEDGRWPQAVTGITDEAGVRYGSYAYDAEGRVTRSELAGGAERLDFAYATDATGKPTTTVTDYATGSATLRSYTFADIGGLCYPLAATAPFKTGSTYATARSYSASNLATISNGNTPQTTMNAPSPWPLWIAHRGAGKVAPENTLAAFRRGAQYGYAAFECDVKLSADGVPFLLHDATLDRTSNAQGVAGDKPWTELSRVDVGSWHSRAYAGEPLPTLDNIAAFCHASGHALNIEIKPTPGTDRHTGEIVARQAEHLWAGCTTPPLLSSFQPDALEGARAGAPNLPRALLIDSLYDGWFDLAQRLGCVAVVANYKLFSGEMVARLHDAQQWALCYTVNDESAARHLLGLGLDGLITDAVDRFSPHAGRLGV